MSYLLIDIGNSYSKYALVDNNRLSSIFHIKNSEFIDALNSGTLKISESPESIVLVSVIEKDLTNNIIDKLSEFFNCAVQQIKTSPIELGVTCGYTNYSLLGADRWVAMIAAFSRVKHSPQVTPVLVVDCGTVITVDVVNAEGQHLGGWMIPGRLLMSQALEQKASGILAGLEHSEPDLQGNNAQQDEPVIGKSTRQCVNAGGQLAEAGFITQCLLQAEKLLGVAPLCILTGGGAKEIVPLLTMRLEYVPELVLDGLALFTE